MPTTAPDILVRRGFDGGLAATIAASAVLHAVGLLLLIIVPAPFLRPAPRLESYTVDLVAPNVIGGTNLRADGGAAKPAERALTAPPPAPPEPAPAAPVPDAAPPAAEPQPVPKAVEAPPAPVQRAVEPPLAAKPAEPPPPPAVPVKAPEPAAAPVAVVKPPPPKPAPPVEPKPADVKVPAKPAPAQPAPAKPVDVPKPAAKVVEPAKAPPKPVEPATAKATAAAAEAAKAAKQRDDAIAAAVRRRAGDVQTSDTARRESLDKQIAAAVQRRAQQVGAGSGSGPAGSGGPVSVGPGTGAGGAPTGIEYILYQARMEQKIKAAWAWAGADRALLAVIQFNLTSSGQIENIRTVQSSGDRQYDASCERAVRAANPLEPVPDRYRKEFATVELTFKPSDLER